MELIDGLVISVITPAYNAGKYISEAIQSVLSQTYPHWELLIVNDGSTDNTEEKVHSFNDLRIKYFLQENQGVSSARNVGLANMQGDYFCFLDADDIIPPRSIESRIEVFLSDDKIAFVDGRVLKKDVNFQNTIKVYQPSFQGNPYNELLSISEKCFFGPTWMIKRNKNQTYQFKEELTHSEDLAFYLSIAHQGLYATTLEEILWYRTSNNSAMTNLKGLEQGYASLYSEIKHNHNVSGKQLRYLKYKITRIMVLSYLRLQRNLRDAVRVFFHYAKL